MCQLIGLDPLNPTNTQHAVHDAIIDYEPSNPYFLKCQSQII
jgi:hypothetical protein